MKVKSRKKEYRASDWDESKSVGVVPESRPVGISTSIRLPKGMITKLKRIAHRKGDIGYQTLLKMWIAERLEEESA